MQSVRLLAVLTAVGLLGACGSTASTAGKNGASSSAPPTTTAVTSNGGTLTVGAEQEPDCFDWLGNCAASSWGSWMAQYQTIPRVFDVDPRADGSLRNVPSNLVTSAPVFAAKPVETITYHLNPKAQWSDGVPITCSDFAYTVDQEKSSDDILDRTGYSDIARVDCSQPLRPVVTYKAGAVYAGWQNLFSGNTGVYPSHLLEGRDRDSLMKNGYHWSGGPWFADWTKGDNITLTPNTKYWGDKPHLDKVVFKFESDTAAEFQAFRSKQVQAIYPNPQIDVVDAIAQGLPSAHVVTNSHTAYVEALWIDNARYPFTDVAVRRAFAYAVDRDAVVKQLFGRLGVDEPSNSINAYALKDYSDQSAWSKYHLDLSMVTKLMTNAGWKKNALGVWAKDGKTASFTITTTAGDKRRQLTTQVVQQELKDAGFAVKVDFRSLAQIGGTDLPAGNLDVLVIASGLAGLTPGQCSQFCSQNVPGPANQNSGQNYFRIRNPKLDTLLEGVDNSLDDATRRADAAKADDLMAADVNVLPLDPLPDILIWSSHVVGPITDNSIEGMFWNINEWGCTNGVCA
ncbi:MAG TPA: ABC transporter substrate-binding protein [Acidimicrobiia bacterium]|nr:ABC transporter substrate-binding protein [Acidimicrobiia bacterium]